MKAYKLFDITLELTVGIDLWPSKEIGSHSKLYIVSILVIIWVL